VHNTEGLTVTVLDFVGSVGSDSRRDDGTSIAGAVQRSGIAVVQVHDSLWRVTLPAGDVLGYIERLPPAEGSRFRAKRYLTSRRSFFSLGEFWEIDDAFDCFRMN
jgi:hypothetical protein